MDQATAAATGMTLAFHAEQSPDRLAIISEHGNRTFAELNANSNKVVRALRARGVGAGDSVSLVCANRPEFAEVLNACNRMGIRTTTVNWHLTGEEMGYILDNSDAKAVFGDARFAHALTAAVEQAPNVAVKIAIAGPIDGFEDYDKVIAPEDGSDIDDPVLGRTMLYTSGTTGRPKGVDRPAPSEREKNAAAAPRLDKEGNPIPDAGVSLALNVGGSAKQKGDEGDRHLCTGPLYHAAPLAFSLAGPLAAGCGVVLMDGWSAEETLRLIDEHKVTHSHMVATMFHRLLALPDDVKAKYDVSSLRYLIHGAAPCPVSVKKGLMEWLGPIVYEYYAATEGGGTFVGPEEWLQKPGTVGKRFHPELLVIQDAEGNELPSTGRYRYYKDDEKTA
jgi:long-chain acyl-CoA synthetase